MKNVFEAYRKHYEKDQSVKVTVRVLDQPVLFPEYEKEIEERSKPEPLPEIIPEVPTGPNKPDHIVLFQEIMAQESKVRNYRESLRCKYYDLEAKNAPLRDFAENHKAITKQTKILQDLYVQRRHIEIYGKAPDKHVILNDDQVNQIKALKNDRGKVVDKIGKLNKKIDTYLSKAKGESNRPKWEMELEQAQLTLLEIDLQINKINGLTKD